MYLSLCVPHCMCVLSLFQGGKQTGRKKGAKNHESAKNQGPTCVVFRGWRLRHNCPFCARLFHPPPPQAVHAASARDVQTPSTLSQQSKLNKLVQAKQKKACFAFIYQSNDALLSILNRSSVGGGGSQLLQQPTHGTRTTGPPTPPPPLCPHISARLKICMIFGPESGGWVGGVLYSRPLHD
jgi:hypothetical protein